MTNDGSYLDISYYCKKINVYKQSRAREENVHVKSAKK